MLRENQLYANKKKCVFRQPCIEYLGHVLSSEGESADPSKIRAVKD